MRKGSPGREKIRFILNAVIVLLVLYAWLIMFFNTREGVLTSKGFTNLKYYTTLSNIFAGAVAAVWAGAYLAGRKSASLSVWKLASAASVGVTFIVVIGFLGPLYGFGGMYKRSNFFFHLVVPVLAMADYILFNEEKPEKKQTLSVLLPPLIYGAVYIINTLIRGVEGNDIYGFLTWGYPAGILIFAVICAAAYGIGALLGALNAGAGKKKPSAKEVPVRYDPETQYAVIRSSICNGEQVAGFKDKAGGHFTEVMLIRSAEDERYFKEIYGLDEVKKEY